MGEVYLARDTQLGRDVAVKVLPSSYVYDKERLQRFEQEACAASALNHPNILSIYDVGTHEGAPYVVSELLEGQTLRQRLNGAQLPLRKTIDYALKVAQGLAAAHEKGIVHRLFSIRSIGAGIDQGFPGNGYYAPARDGKRFLVTASPEAPERQQINVILNWTADLKR